MRASVLMKMSRDYVLTSRYGHSIRFVKDVETSVPRSALTEARAAGAMECGEQDSDGLSKNEELRNEEVPMSQDEVRDALFSAFAKLEARNQRGDFNASGKPAIAAVREFVDFTVSAKDAAVSWNEYLSSSERNAEEDNTTSPGLES